MSKVSAYLQGHIIGEISTRNDDRNRASFDQSILQQKPDMVMYPRSTNDIRKLVRFSSQLASKGHILAIHPRGLGQGVTGGSLGSGVVLDTSKYLNRIFEYDPKQKLVRVQPGASIATLDSTLGLQGMSILPLRGVTGTVGGAVADDGGGIYAATYGSTNSSISQLEVVLDSGDVIQTGPLSKRELNKRKGLQGREGDIYRGIDGVLEDHAEFIRKGQKDGLVDRSGYAGIFDVEAKPGQFDLTPLFVGSQGTLGIISEMIMKIDFIARDVSMAVLAFDDLTVLQGALATIIKQNPTFFTIYDGDYFRQAAQQGCSFEWLPVAVDQVKFVALVGYDDMNEHVRKRNIMRMVKACQKLSIATFTPNTTAEADSVNAVFDITKYAVTPFDGSEQTAVVLAENIYIPDDKFIDFLEGVERLSAEAQLPLLLDGSVLSNMYSLRVQMSLARVGDKQKYLKLIAQVAATAKDLDGALVGAGGDGQILGYTVRNDWDEEYRQICDEIKKIFDPNGILNPAVKHATDVKDLVKSLRSHNSSLA